jgi:hypothetical protein
MAIALIVFHLCVIVWFLSLIAVSDLAIYLKILVLERGRITTYLNDKYRPGTHGAGRIWDVLTFVLGICWLALLTTMCLVAFFYGAYTLVAIFGGSETAALCVFWLATGPLAIVFGGTLWLANQEQIVSISRSWLLPRFSSMGLRVLVIWHTGSWMKQPHEALWSSFRSSLWLLPITIMIVAVASVVQWLT